MGHTEQEEARGERGDGVLCVGVVLELEQRPQHTARYGRDEGLLAEDGARAEGRGRATER